MNWTEPTFYFLLRILFSVFFTVFAFLGASCVVSADPVEENWVGWIESPQEHLRWIVQFSTDPTSNRVTGTVKTPDHAQEAIALSNVRLKADDWGFDWVNAATKQQLKFAGNMDTPDQVTGLLSLDRKHSRSSFARSNT